MSMNDVIFSGVLNDYVQESRGHYETEQASLQQTNTIQNTSKGDEDIYVAPPCEEEALYATLEDDMMEYIKRSSLQLNAKLGSGQFGDVYKGLWHNSSSDVVTVAIKTLKKGAGDEDRVKFLQEAAIMAQFKDPNVVTMHGIVMEGVPILLVLELLSKGDLRNHLLNLHSSKNEKVAVDGHTLLSYCRQIVSGMVYLSGKNFVHRDLAARNILVSNQGICKIADFGMARDVIYEAYYTSRGGMIPVKWTAPEIMRLLDSGYRLPPPPGCPRKIYSLMINCWHPKPANRPNFLDVRGDMSLPDTTLLQWNEENDTDKQTASQLGGNLQLAENMFIDLQNTYKY